MAVPLCADVPDWVAAGHRVGIDGSLPGLLPGGRLGVCLQLEQRRSSGVHGVVRAVPRRQRNPVHVPRPVLGNHLP